MLATCYMLRGLPTQQADVKVGSLGWMVACKYYYPEHKSAV